MPVIRPKPKVPTTPLIKPSLKPVLAGAMAKRGEKEKKVKLEGMKVKKIREGRPGGLTPPPARKIPWKFRYHPLT